MCGDQDLKVSVTLNWLEEGECERNSYPCGGAGELDTAVVGQTRRTTGDPPTSDGAQTLLVLVRVIVNSPSKLCYDHNLGQKNPSQSAILLPLCVCVCDAHLSAGD